MIILYPREENESVFVSRTKKEKRGDKGESDVSLYLYEIINKYGGYLFNDFCFRTENDSSTEIDHILITRGMVFVIETKNNFGYVRGHERDKYWHCIKLDNYAHSTLLFNPLWQNKGHVKQLTNLFIDKSVKIIPMVIFPSANIMQLDSKDVFKIETAINFIENAVRNEKKQILKNLHNGNRN